MIWLVLGCAQEGIEGWWVEVHGKVVDELGAPISGASITLLTGDGAAVAQVGTSSTGDWRVPLFGTDLDGNVLVGVVSAPGMAEGRATWEVNLRSPETTTLRAGPGQEWYATSRRLSTVTLATDAASASVTGHLVDGQTGLPVVGAALSLQEGWNASVGDAAVAAATTRDAGAFSFTASRPGMYTVTVAEGESWAASRFPALLTADGGTVTGMVGPVTAAGQIFAAAVWKTATDLDLHLSAPKKGGFGGDGQYHLWAEEPDHPNYVDEDERDAWMVRTDSDGEGPEALWVDSLAAQGDVRLALFDNDNVSDPATTALADSGALLQLWFGEDTPRFWQVSPGEVATLWHPISVDVATSLPYVVEEYSYGEDPHDGDAF